MEIIAGNILNATEDIIIHQVNCKGVMGSGLAKQIKEKWPIVFKKYKELCDDLSLVLLGEIQFVTIEDIDKPKTTEKNKIIANVFGQFNYGNKEKHTDYEALKSAFNDLRDYALEHNYSIAIPYKIGCGLGGGDWDIVSEIICEELTDIKYKIYSIEKIK